MIHIGGAHQGDPFPGEDEHRAAIHGMQETHCLGNRQPPRREDEMAAAQGPNARRGPHLPPQLISPGSRRINHHFAVYFDRAPRWRIMARLVPQPNTYCRGGMSGSIAQYLPGGDIVEGQGTVGDRLAYQA